MADQLEDIKEVEAEINSLQKKLDRLKILYEQYFMGIEKREPLTALKDVVRTMRFLENINIRNTALRFRLRTLVQKFNSYRTYWNRTTRAIERGTYHRDVAKMKRRINKRGISLPPSRGLVQSMASIEQSMAQVKEIHDPSLCTPPPSDDKILNPLPSMQSMEGQASAKAPPTVKNPLVHGIDTSDEKIRQAGLHALDQRDIISQNYQARPIPTREPPQAKTPEATRDISANDMQSIYRRFIKAKKMCGEDTKSIQYEALEKSINRQLPKLREKAGDKRIDFQVVIRNGRAFLKAVTK